MPPDTSPRVELFPFRFRDPVSGKWLRARYVATREEMTARYAQWEIIGEAEVRTGNAAMFSPFAKPFGHLPIPEPDEPPPETPPEEEPEEEPVEEPPEEEPPFVDPTALARLERFLVLLFLRRYVTWCARRRRFAAMEGAARLFSTVQREARA